MCCGTAWEFSTRFNALTPCSLHSNLSRALPFTPPFSHSLQVPSLQRPHIFDLGFTNSRNLSDSLPKILNQLVIQELLNELTKSLVLTPLQGTKIVMECVVEGIIETQHVEALEILLQGLCGVAKERFRIHELCLKSAPNLGSVSSEVRLLCDLEQPTPNWTVRHVGGAMRGAGAEQISVAVRTMVESKVSKNALRFFYSLGYKLDHELLKVGFAFHFQRAAQIKVTVTSVNKMLKLHATEEAVPVTPGIQLVEVTAPAAADNYVEVVAAISSFCEYLAPLLHLSKPGVSAGVVPTAAAAAASLMSNRGGKTL